MGLGRRLVGTRILIFVDGIKVRVITGDGELLRELTLDPRRDYHSQQIELNVERCP